jgi:hypothetical protein
MLSPSSLSASPLFRATPVHYASHMINPNPALQLRDGCFTHLSLHRLVSWHSRGVLSLGRAPGPSSLQLLTLLLKSLSVECSFPGHQLISQILSSPLAWEASEAEASPGLVRACGWQH